jgi:hypothetical protein
MVSNDMMIVIIASIIILLIIIGIRYIYNKNNYERNIINLVLSKLEFYPNHYKIIKKDNKIFIKCHLLYNDYIYNDASLERTNHLIFNGGLKIVDIIIDLDEKKYKIIIIGLHIINTSNDIFNEFKKNLNSSSYYFINNIIDLDFDININEIGLCNIEVYDSAYMYIYNETSNYNKYICNRYNILLTNDKESIYINSISNSFPSITYQPLLSNEIRIKEIQCLFI